MSNGTILLHRHLNGETLTEDECAELSAWVCASPDHAKLAAELTCLDQTILTNLRHRASAPLMDTPADEEAGLIDQALQRDAYAPEIMQELVAQAQARRAHTHPADLDAPIQMQAEPTRRFTASDARWVAGKLFNQAIRSKATAISAIAAVLLLAIVLVVSFNNETQPPVDESVVAQAKPAKPTAVATLTAEHDAHWAEGAFAPGSSLKAGQRLTLTQGLAEITTNDGAIALLEAPATIELTDNNALRLHTGKLVGICETKSSKGFLVRTPHMDITDLGTRFGVDVSRAGTAEAHVFEGEIDVALPAFPGGRPNHAKLVAGEAVRVSEGSDRLVLFKIDPDRFTQALPARYLPEGTGYGLNPGDTDPNWRVVAVNGQPITNGGEMRVVYPEYGDSASSRWLLVPRDVVPQDTSERTITCRVSLQIPAAFDPDTSELVLGFNADHRVAGIRVNGTAVEVPENELDRNAPLTEVAIQHLARPGRNTIELDLYDHNNHSALRAAFELKPRSE